MTIGPHSAADDRHDHGLSQRQPGPSATSAQPQLPPRVIRGVLGQYDLGEILSLEPILKGGIRSPKLLVTTGRGRFVLKMREADNPFEVAFTHRISLALLRAGVPVPRLIGTSGENNSLVQSLGRVFELTAYINGRRYRSDRADTAASGRMLAKLHRVLDTDASLAQHAPPLINDGQRVDAAINRVRGMISDDPHARADLEHACEMLAHARRTLGVHPADDEPSPIIALVHGDWHPGNLIFQDDPENNDGQNQIARVSGVLDLDRCGMGSRADELAFAALQHGMIASDDQSQSCAAWPAKMDLERVAAFIESYTDQQPASDHAINHGSHEPEPVHRGIHPAIGPADMFAERMLVRLLNEAFTRLAAEGRIGTHAVPAVLAMLRNKGDWLRAHTQDIRRTVEHALGTRSPD